MDGWSEVLTSCRLRGTVFSRARLGAPWSVDSGDLSFGIFHAVVEGEAYLLRGEERPLLLEQGSIVFLPHGGRHIMCSDPSLPSVPLREHTRPGEPAHLLEVDRGGEMTRLICGSFTFDCSETHPLLGALPRVIRVPRNKKNARWIDATLGLLMVELEAPRPGGGSLIARLTDVLLVQALRWWIENAGPSTAEGWIRGLSDPGIARALGCVHGRPEESWTVESLARQAAMSRSSFAARFSELVGESPSRYLTRWRMHLAARALTQEQRSMAEIAEAIGYSSEHAFSKAFKRHLGISPGAFRRSEGELRVDA